MAYVQAQAHSPAIRVTTGSTISKAYGSNNTAGSLLVACLCHNTSSGNTATGNVTDTAGNKWRQVGEASNGARAVAIWYCDRSLGGANTVTATLTDSGAINNMQMDLLEYTGSAATNYELIDSQGWASSTGTTLTATTLDSCAADDLLVSALGSNKTPATIPSGWTADVADTTTSNGWHVAHLLDSTGTGTKSAAWTGLTSTSSPAHIGVIAAFRQTGVASTAPHLLQSACVRSSTGGTSVSAAYPTNVAAGSTLVAVVGHAVASGTPTISSITDTQGLTWNNDGSNDDASNLSATDIWSAVNAASGADTLTVNLTPTGTNVDIVLLEFANLPSNMASEGINGTQSNTVAGTSSSVSTSSAATLHDFVIASLRIGGVSTVSRGTGWTQLWMSDGTNQGVQIHLDSTNAVQTATWTFGSLKNDSLVVAYTAGTPPVVPPLHDVPLTNWSAVNRAMYR